MKSQPAHAGYSSIKAYEALVANLLKRHPGNRDLALALAVGASTMDLFVQQGDVTVAVLCANGLTDGMSVLDLGCGCGRTAQALQRAGWRGSYLGTDIVPSFIAELKAKCPDYSARVHLEPSLPVADASLDMVFHWSVFTHISAEECYLYMADSFRALKPGGRLVFSFVELDVAGHQDIFFRRVESLAKRRVEPILDSFLHRDWICFWAGKAGFTNLEFTDGTDCSRHGAFWQTLAAMSKPLIDADVDPEVCTMTQPPAGVGLSGAG